MNNIMNNPDFRALCAELLAIIPAHGTGDPNSLVIARARAALAQPEPVVPTPTDEDLDELFTEIDQSGEALSWRVYARAVLARYGTPAIQPVPVSERLPGPEDRDPKLQRCWWLYPGFKESWESCSRPREGVTHWLPHWALPVPK